MQQVDKNITVYLIARLNSERLPRKMLLPFEEDKTSLFERACINLKDIKFPFKAAIGEKELIDIANKHHVEIELRDQKELDSNGNLLEVFSFLKKTKTTHAMLISPCNPFITKEIINNACEVFISNDFTSLTSVVKEQNWYFDKNQKPLFEFNPYRMNSKDLEIYSLANVIEIFPLDRFVKEGIFYTFSNKIDPYFYELNKINAVDIDNQIDFEIAKSLLRNM